MSTRQRRYRPKPPPKVTGIGPVKSGETYGKHLDAVAAKRTAVDAKRTAAAQLAADKKQRRSELLAAASDFAGERVKEREGKTHNPKADPIRKSGASNGAKKVDYDNYKNLDPTSANLA